jgi:hypothetical protein
MDDIVFAVLFKQNHQKTREKNLLVEFNLSKFVSNHICVAITKKWGSFGVNIFLLRIILMSSTS